MRAGHISCVLSALCLVAYAPAQQSSNISSDDSAAAVTTSTRANYRRLADETDANSKTQVLANWYPRAIDSDHGGFIQNFNEDWTKAPGDAKGICL